MKSFLDECKEEMDFVIIDTPPMQISSDAEVVSSLVDSTLLIIRRDWADVRDINDGMDTIKQGSAEFLGYVLNDVYENKKMRSSKDYSNYGNAIDRTGE
jgi:Mrp family chromosome partitioning ATPase